MKPLVLHVSDGESFGGAEQILLSLLRATDRDKFRLALAYHPSDEMQMMEEGARELGVDLWPVPRMDPGWDGLRRIPAFVRGLRQRAPAIVHAHLTWPLGCQYQLLSTALVRRIRVVATIHAYVHLDLSWRVDRQQRLYTHAVDRYIAVAPHVKDLAVQELHWPAEKIVVIRDGIDLERFHRPADAPLRNAVNRPHVPTVLVAARMDENKGHRHVVAAAAELPGVRFLFAGDGPERPSLERLARDLRVDDRVEFLGQRADIPDLLATSDIAVLASGYEALPIAILEAMAAHVPVVTSDIVGLRYLVRDGETGILFEPGNSAALASGIRRVIDDPSGARRMADAAFALVTEHYANSRLGRDVVRLYEDLLST